MRTAITDEERRHREILAAIRKPRTVAELQFRLFDWIVISIVLLIVLLISLSLATDWLMWKFTGHGSHPAAIEQVKGTRK
jgi:hypothetical protein